MTYPDDGNWVLDDLILHGELASYVFRPLDELMEYRVRPATYGLKLAGDFTNFFWHLGRERRMFDCARRTILS